MGLGWPALSSAFQQPVPFTQYNQGVGTKGVFGLALSMTAGKSSLTFGGWDRTKLTGYITYYPCGFVSHVYRSQTHRKLTPSSAQNAGADYRTYWQVAASAPFVNGVQAISTRVNMILDSGTTLIIAPAAAAAEFWAKVPGSAKYDANFWTYPCASPPTVEFGLTRVVRHWAVDPYDFNLGYIEGDESRCMGAVATQSLGLGTSWILGDTFCEFMVREEAEESLADDASQKRTLEVEEKLAVDAEEKLTDSDSFQRSDELVHRLRELSPFSSPLVKIADPLPWHPRTSKTLVSVSPPRSDSTRFSSPPYRPTHLLHLVYLLFPPTFISC